DQRPGRGNPGVAGERTRTVPGLRRGHLARSLVPRPHRDSHSRLGRDGGEPGVLVLVRGQLPGLPAEQARTPRAGGSTAPPCHQTAAEQRLAAVRSRVIRKWFANAVVNFPSTPEQLTERSSPCSSASTPAR